MPKVRTKDIIKKFDMELISGEEGINRPITTTDISRPGLEIAGYFEYYPAERLQLLGKTELTFFEKLNPRDRAERMEKLCTDITPGIIVTRDMEVPVELVEAAERESVPLLRSKLKTTRLSSLQWTTFWHLCRLLKSETNRLNNRAKHFLLRK